MRMIYKYKTEKYYSIINCLLIFGTIGLLKKKINWRGFYLAQRKRKIKFGAGRFLPFCAKFSPRQNFS